jgi:uroporphyrinogen-III synthase
MKVLSTKTLANELLTAAQQKGLDILCLDFIKIKPVPFSGAQLSGVKFDSLAFTSSNAVKFFSENPDSKVLVGDKPVFGLIGKTESILTDLGVDVFANSTDAASLADAIIEAGRINAVLHVCGNLKLDILQRKLEAAQIEYHPLIVYETILLKHIVPPDDFEAVMFYSPSGIESFFSQNTLSESTICCCIGDTTAAALKKRMPDAKIILPVFPSPESMMEAMQEHFQKITK